VSKESQDSIVQKRGATVAGRYEIIRPLGRGGIGKVFLVVDKQTGTRLALKMLRSKYQGNERVLARFSREINAVRQLNHPCIVKIFDAQQDGELVFYTMEFIQGKSARKWMNDRGRLQFGSVVRVLALVAHALDHAHAFTIHRDISPENIMVMSDGSVKLLDFGLAKLEDAHQNLTIVGLNLGKVAYMAPEQRINAAEVDHRADLYPLGVMFHEMLTGELPGAGKHFSAYRPDLPKSCDAFLEQALAPDPNDRFQTAGEFREELLAIYREHESGEKRARAKTKMTLRGAVGSLRDRLRRLFQRRR
jgi:serine/threonine protein kinase